MKCLKADVQRKAFNFLRAISNDYARDTHTFFKIKT